MFMKILFIFLLFIHSINNCKILIFNPKLGHSHVNFFGQIADILVDAGYDVTVLVVDMDLSIKHPGTHKAKIYHVSADPVAADLLSKKTKLSKMWETSSSIWAQFDILDDLMKGSLLTGKKLFYDKDLENFVKSQKFDLAITEVFNFYTYGLIKAWNISTTISGSAVGLIEYNFPMFGLHFPASHIPTLMQSSHDKMAYNERFQNFIAYVFTLSMNYLAEYDNSLMSEFDKKYGKDFFNPRQLVGDSSFFLLNSNPFLDIPGPRTAKMVEIAGIGITECQPLSDYWNDILSLRSHTVLISFGSLAQSSEMPIAMKNGIIEMVKRLPDVTFIWKYETPEDGIGKNIDNLILSKWMPQNDLLNDTRLSLFITHGGANSIIELSFRGVPAIAIPIFGDQFSNAKLIEKHDIGLVMDKSLLKNSDLLSSNIKKILFDTKYKNNAHLVSQRLNKRPIGSKELLLQHIKFACEFGQLPVLDLQSRYMNMDAGYDVTVLVVDMDLTIKHPGTHKAKIYHVSADPVAADLLTKRVKFSKMWETSSSVWAQFNLFDDFMKGTQLTAKKLIYDKDLENFVKSQKFDLAITEVFNLYTYGLIKAWNISTTISGSAVGLIDNNFPVFGLHFPASHIPTLMQSSHDKMTYNERFQNFITYVFTLGANYLMEYDYALMHEFDKKYGKGFFNPNQLIGDSSFLLLNSNPFLDIPGPKTSKMVEIAGVGIPECQPLNDYWNDILSLRRHTVLISFGSFVQSSEMPLTMKNGIIKTVKKLPDVTFIWKYDTPEDGIGKNINNLILSKWIPQNDLLNDTRLSLFITHGGANSIVELSFRGVPAIAIPVFGDQFRNAKLIEKHDIGLVMDKSLLKNSDILSSNIKKILFDTKYKNNAHLVSQRLNKRPIGSKELLLQHIKFACEFGQLPVLDLQIYNPKFGHSHVNYLSQITDILAWYGCDVTVLGHSHVNFFGQIADILVDAGYDVTVLVVDMDLTIKHPGTYKAKIYHVSADPIAADLLTNKTKLNKMWETSSSIWAQFDMFDDFMKGTQLTGKKLFYDKDLENFVKSQKFDLAITEVFNLYTYGLIKAWNISTTISGSAVGLIDNNFRDFGLHFPASHIPTLMQSSHDKMTYNERFQNFIAYVFTLSMNYLMEYDYALMYEFDKKYGKGFFNPSQLVGDSSFLLLNSNPFLDIPGPKTAKMVEIAGIGIPECQPLNDYWNDILSLRSHTVLISFGSLAQSSEMPIAMKNGIIETVKRLPDVTFIWKYETPEDGIGKNINNLILSKWIPQNDLLNDTRLSLFITHGGANSIFELSFRGVPAIAIPVFGDQFRNAKLIEKHDIGLVMDKSLLKNPDLLSSNIKKILFDTKYKNNAHLVSQRLNKRPIGSKELLLQHIKFACEFGQLPVLDLQSRYMNSIVYFNLDIIFPIIISFTIIIYFILSLIIKFTKNLITKKVKKD
uniref:glucuronosyltransferase n=1 Tax=Strongyloides stercoralis TaxID=6248 RepID=A0A0K0E427_STRER